MILNLQTYTAFRPNGSVVEGDWVEGNPEEITVSLDVQPDDGKTVQLRPEGWEGRTVLKAYSFDVLRTVSRYGKNKGDRVDIDGVLYEVQESGNWSRWNVAGMGHYKYLLLEMDTQP